MAEPILISLAVGPLQSNCYIYGSNESGRGVIIDPGDEARRVLDEFKLTGLSLEAVINTHAHFDHAGGNRRLKELTGAPLWIHRGDVPLLERLANQALFFLMRTEGSPPPDRLLEHGDVIDLGEVSLTVIHTPGHSPGGICLRGPGLVFVGDTLFAGSVGRTDMPGGSTRDLLDSIRRRLLTLPDEMVVYPGHGPPTTIGEERLANPFLR